MKNKLRIPLRGEFRKTVNGVQCDFKYNAKLDRREKHKYITIELQLYHGLQGSFYSIPLHKLPIIEFISPEGCTINKIVNIQENIRCQFKIVNVKQNILGNSIHCGNNVSTEIIFDIVDFPETYEYPENPANINCPFFPADFPNICNLDTKSFINDKTRIDKTLQELAVYFEKYLIDCSSLSPSKITYANFEGIIKVFHSVAKIIGESDCDHKELNNIIRKWCNFLRDHHDTEMDNIIIASNKFTTSVQLFQEKIETVAEGGDWKKVFLESSNIFRHQKNKNHENHKNHKNHKNHESHESRESRESHETTHGNRENKVQHTTDHFCASDDKTRINDWVHHDKDCVDKNPHINNASDSHQNYDVNHNYISLPTRTKHEYNTECALHMKKCNKSHNPRLIHEKICRETTPQNLCRYVNVVNEMYFSIHLKKPSTEELLYYVNLLEKKEINSQDLYKLL
jgi:hypothetical protein